MKLIAVFAHPDDESFAVGGTLAKYAATGIEVVIVSATKGEAGISGVRANQAGALREAELRRAAAELGASQVHFLGYLDGSLPDVDPDEAIDRLVALLGRLQPQVLITFGPDGISGHPDHVAISRWVTAAFDALNGPDAPRKLYYVAPSLATQQGCQVADAPPLPAEAVGVDVEAHRVAKVRAMQAHASQDPPYRGDPIQEAERLECHEWFVLARSRLPSGNGQDGDLFAGLRRNDATRSNGRKNQIKRGEQRMRLYADDSKCSGCRACLVACSLHLFGENNPKKAALTIVPHFPTLGTFEVHVCTQCGDCAAVCPVDAIHQNEKGAYYVSPGECTLCMACVDECPEGVIFTRPDVDYVWECDLCGECVDVCGPGVLWIAD